MIRHFPLKTVKRLCVREEETEKEGGGESVEEDLLLFRLSRAAVD